MQTPPSSLVMAAPVAIAALPMAVSTGTNASSVSDLTSLAAPPFAAAVQWLDMQGQDVKTVAMVGGGALLLLCVLLGCAVAVCGCCRQLCGVGSARRKLRRPRAIPNNGDGEGGFGGFGRRRRASERAMQLARAAAAPFTGRGRRGGFERLPSSGGRNPRGGSSMGSSGRFTRVACCDEDDEYGGYDYRHGSRR